MADLRKRGSTSNLIRFKIVDKSTGQGKTGLTGSTSGLIISTICDNESTATAYTQAASHIQTIATLGTYAAPSASSCRFGEVDSTNHKGLYEFQFADTRFAVANSRRLVISVNDAEATILDADYEIEFTNQLVSDVWDEINTGATHNIANSTGKQLRSITTSATDIIYTETLPAQTGMSSTQFQLSSGASGTAQIYQWDVISVISGTGAGQSKIITNYTTGRVGTVQSAWTTQPDNTSVIEITPTASVSVVSYITGQDPASLVLDVAASSHNVASSIGADINLISSVYSRLGAPAGASMSADIAGVKSDTGTILTDVNTGAGAIYTRLGAPAGASIAADIAAVKSDTGTISTNVSALPSAAQNSDKLLGRTISGGADGGRTVAQALEFLRHRWAISSGVLTVYAADDSTPSWTSNVSTAPDNPVNQSAPTT